MLFQINSNTFFIFLLLDGIWVNTCLLFAIAIHDSIMAVHSLHGVVWSGWFADDGTIQAPLPVLECALTTLSTSLAAHNITINFAKTKIVTQDPRSVDFYDTLRGLVRVPLANGFPLLGGHIPGSTLPSFLTARLRLEEFRLLCSKIGQLPEAFHCFHSITLLHLCMQSQSHSAYDPSVLFGYLEC